MAFVLTHFVICLIILPFRSLETQIISRTDSPQIEHIILNKNKNRLASYETVYFCRGSWSLYKSADKCLQWSFLSITASSIARRDAMGHLPKLLCSRYNNIIASYLLKVYIVLVKVSRQKYQSAGPKPHFWSIHADQLGVRNLKQNKH